MASPVTITMLMRSSPTSRHTVAGSNLSTSTILLPMKLPLMTPHWLAPCMSGAMGSEVIGLPASPFSTNSSGRVLRSPVIRSMP